MRIAYLEDEQAHAQLVTDWLEEAGHSCKTFTRADAFKRDLSMQSYDLLLLDWELPDQSGIEVLKWFRTRSDWRAPVLFMTNRDAEEDIVLALSEGADDYMTKPLSKAITLARIEALSRRYEPVQQTSDDLELEGYRIDRNQRVIYQEGQAIDLTDKEFQLALTLFSNVGRLFSRDHLLESVWGVGPGLTTRTVDTHVSRIRRKLSLIPEAGWRLKAIYNHGYRLERILPEPASG